MVYLNELEPANGLKTSNTTWNFRIYSGRDVYVYKTPISTYDVFYRITDGDREIYPTQKDLENGEWAWKCKTIDGAVKSLNIRGFYVKKDDFTRSQLYWYDCERLSDDRDKLNEEAENADDEDWKNYLYSKIEVYDKAIKVLEDSKNDWERKQEKDKPWRVKPTPRQIIQPSMPILGMPTPGEKSIFDEAAITGKNLFDI